MFVFKNMCKILTIKQAIVLLLQIKIMYTISSKMFIIIALEQGSADFYK